MSKAARKARRAGGERIEVADAIRLIDVARSHQLAKYAELALGTTPDRENMAIWSAALVDQWATDKVVLRADPTLIDALLDTDRDTELPPDWLDRFPFRSVAISLVKPLSLNTARGRITLLGVIATGYRVKTSPLGITFDHVPFAHADGVHHVWLYDKDDDCHGAYAMAPLFRGGHGTSLGISPARTIQDLIEQAGIQEDRPDAPGVEAEVLVPLTVMLLLYLCAAEPDLTDLPPQRVVRPQPLLGARVANLGWRIGATLRQAQAASTTATGAAASTTPRPGGWTVTPHLRRPHFRRSRVATRDQDGNVIGDVHGEYGIDWTYVLHWIPLAEVNCGPDGPAPTVRPIASPATPDLADTPAPPATNGQRPYRHSRTRRGHRRPTVPSPAGDPATG